MNGGKEEKKDGCKSGIDVFPIPLRQQLNRSFLGGSMPDCNQQGGSACSSRRSSRGSCASAYVMGTSPLGGSASAGGSRRSSAGSRRESGGGVSVSGGFFVNPADTLPEGAPAPSPVSHATPSSSSGMNPGSLLHSIGSGVVGAAAQTLAGLGAAGGGGGQHEGVAPSPRQRRSLLLPHRPSLGGSSSGAQSGH